MRKYSERTKNYKTRFTMLVGLPGSGKSTIAKRLMNTNPGSVWISSDCIRKELFGDESMQKDPGKVFDLMHIRTLSALKSGKDVIYDACNTSSKRRSAFLKNLKRYDCKKNCIIAGTPYDMCLKRNASRERVVPESAIERMYKSWKTPAFYEGWDHITLSFAEGAKGSFGDAYDFVKQYADYDQMNPFHEEPLGEHMMNTQKYVIAHGYAPDSNIALAALLHDCGKPCTKDVQVKEDGTKTAHYYQHDGVGGYNALFFDYHGKIEQDILEISLIINLHMFPFFWQDEDKAHERLKSYWGKDLYEDVLAIHDADMRASVSRLK